MKNVSVKFLQGYDKSLFILSKIGYNKIIMAILNIIKIAGKLKA